MAIEDAMRRVVERKLGESLPSNAPIQELYCAILDGNASQVLRLMTTEKNVTDNIMMQIQDAEDKLAELYRKAKSIEKLGQDSDYPRDSVIFFKRKFGDNKLYTYCAVKTPVGWYVTGQDSGNFDWDTLVLLHLSKATEVWFASEWTKVL